MPDSPVILVINDDRIQLRLVESTLQQAGMEVLACRSGNEALRLLAGGVRVDLIATDLHMRDIDGWTLCSLLRSADYLACNWVPILAMSAITEEEGREVALQLGADGFLAIPYTREEMQAKVRELLDKRVLEARRTIALRFADERLATEVERCFLNTGDVIQQVARFAELGSPDAPRPDVFIFDAASFHEDARQALTSLFPTGWPITVVITNDVPAAEKVNLIRAGADTCVDWPEAKNTLVFLLVRLRRLRALVARERAGVSNLVPPPMEENEEDAG